MQVVKINAYKDVFKNHLEITQSYNELYKYECLQNFQDNWDLSALDLHTMYDKSLTSTISGRLWGGSTNSAKEMMLRFIEQDKEFVRSMFRDLYKEEKDLNMRINRFKFHLDQMLEQLSEKNQNINSHYHTDEEVSVYLAFNHPDKYTLFKYGPFNIMMNRLGAKNVPQEFEVDRYYKLCKGLYTMLSKDAELLSLHKEKRAESPYYQEDTMLIVHDYLLICSQKPPI